MTANPSHSRALRLPRDFALLAVGLDALLFVINMAALLLPSTPQAGQMRQAYAIPGVWIMLLAGTAVSWVLVATLSWSHARNALERQGVARVALADDARLRFGGVWVLVLVLNYYALTPLFYEVQVLFMPGGRFADVFGDSPLRISMSVAMVLQSLIQLAVTVLGLWLAARIALMTRRGASIPAQEETLPAEVPGASPSSPRWAVAMVAAAMLAGLQLWGGIAVARWAPPGSDVDAPTLLLAWVLPALVTFALAFWGGWLGTRPGLSIVRPFRAVAAAVLAFLLVQVGCIVIAIVWLFMAATASFSFYGGGGLVGFILALVLLYMALTVLLMRFATRWLYRRYL